jgi:hypothetical protein
MLQILKTIIASPILMGTFALSFVTSFQRKTLRARDVPEPEIAVDFVIRSGTSLPIS